MMAGYGRVKLCRDVNAVQAGLRQCMTDWYIHTSVQNKLLLNDSLVES